ncbi:hypothetical protein [Corynebacterium tapiri]|uniref:Holin n=1 Tax=Corynebacterium tapiri TaxID=1448266 RepID=A0A5C4U692_9CORY|nr:hypothetical protein [Corynebacterium tapiri]TNL98764.1 hypothetical protein FHE74_03865 [Corynebacterium tapiri]
MANHYKNSPKPRAVIGTPWFVRLAVYVVVAAVGLALTVAGIVQPEQVDSWLGQTGSLAALIGGLLAAVNTGRESDEKPVGVSLSESLPAQEPEPAKPMFSAYM